MPFWQKGDWAVVIQLGVLPAWREEVVVAVLQGGAVTAALALVAQIRLKVACAQS